MLIKEIPYFILEKGLNMLKGTQQSEMSNIWKYIPFLNFIKKKMYAYFL